MPPRLLRLALGVLALAASARADIVAWPAGTAMVVDGRLDEPAWRSAPASEPFRGPLRPDGSSAVAAPGTRVQVLWDADHLYVGFTCDGPPGPTTLTAHDAELHREEVVEVFLDYAGDGKTCVEVQASPAGVTADLRHTWAHRPDYPVTSIDPAQRAWMSSDRGWDLPGLRAAAVRTAGGWTAELVLPVAGLPGAGGARARLGPGTTVRINFVRYHYAPDLQPASWSPVLRGRPHVSPMALRMVRCVEPSTLASAWADGAQLLAGDARRAFAAAAPTREARFGEATMLLNTQPKTSANLARARELLEALVNEPPDDDYTVMAGYFLGRLAQVHEVPADPARALACYDRVWRDHPEHLFAQLAGVKACVLRLYGADPAAAPADRLARAEAEAPRFTQPEARRDYELVMADACARLGGADEAQLAHLLAAEEAGYLDKIGRADLDVRVAELARLAGQKERAIAYYRKFLGEYTREMRVYQVRQRLRELEAAP